MIKFNLSNRIAIVTGGAQGFGLAITKKLQPNVISLMFGEACSAVPVYKKRTK